MEHKTVRVELKQGAEESGAFRAVIATFNVIDHDGDVTLPGAFPEGKVVPISAYGHTSWGGALPVGKGTIHQDDERAWVEGRFFLDTTPGKETYLTVKALADEADGAAGQEWSYGYDPVDAELGQFEEQDVRFLKMLDVHEASPVLLGAGIDTGMIDIKSSKTAVGVHHTATSDAPWDGGAAVANLREDEDAAYYKRCFAWSDPDGEASAKSTYKFPHHMVGEDGSIGAANEVACIAIVASLNGARGGASIPESERAGVYAHAAAHLRDADREPPELRSKSTTFPDEGDTALAAVLAFIDRARSLADLRAKDGRVLSESNRNRLASLGAAISEAKAEIDRLTAPDEPAVSAVRALAIEARAGEARIRAELLRGEPA